MEQTLEEKYQELQRRYESLKSASSKAVKHLSVVLNFSDYAEMEALAVKRGLSKSGLMVSLLRSAIYKDENG